MKKHSPAGSGKKVAIVTTDIKGVIKCGGVGTSNAALAETLVAAGHEVTIFFAPATALSRQWIVDWQLEYSSKGIRLELIPEPSIPLEGHAPMMLSYAIYLHMKEMEFEIIHFSDMHGVGFYCLLAKKQGLAFQNSLLCVEAHGPSNWHKEGNNELPGSPEDLTYFHLERKSVEYADVLFSPSSSMLRWLQSTGWKLPSQVEVMSFPYPPLAKQGELEYLGRRSQLDEIVFFGRLETRKGLELFCDALELLPPHFLRNKTVTFLGVEGIAHWQPAGQYLEKRRVNWRFKWQWHSDFGQEAALQYLSRRNVLAVLPSFAETLGYTLIECAETGIPFIASDIESFGELLQPRHHKALLFDLTPESLAHAIHSACESGVPRGELRISQKELATRWSDWHFKAPKPKQLRVPQPVPRVSVCLVHKNRHQFLHQALDSLEKQTAKNFEVILMDDGSDDALSLRYLKSLTLPFKKRGWKLVRSQTSVGPCVQRNRAAKLARGEYLLFMDDDNIAKPEEIETFLKAALNTGADALTCAFDRFSSMQPPKPHQIPKSRWLAMGDSLAIGFIFNCYGDMNSFIKREVFLKLGGLRELKNVAGEDAEFFTRLVLAGYKMQFVPEALVWYRVHGENYSKNIDRFQTSLLMLKPYESILEQPEFAILMRFFRGVMYRVFPATGNGETRKVFHINETPMLGSADHQFKKRIFMARDAQGFQKLGKKGKIRLFRLPSGIKVETQNETGTLLLPKLQEKKRLLIEVEMTAVAPTICSLIYHEQVGKGRISKRAMTQNVSLGQNRLRFYVDHFHIKGALQFSPGSTAQQCLIRSLEIRTEP